MNREATMLRLNFALTALEGHLDTFADDKRTTAILGKSYFMHGGELFYATVLEMGGFEEDSDDSAWELMFAGLATADANDIATAIYVWLADPNYMEVA